MAKSLSQSLGDWVTPSIWASKHRFIFGRPMMFYSRKDPLCYRPWLPAIIDDPSPRIVVMKARQMGVTEANLCTRALHFGTLVTSTTVYTLPTNPKADEIAREKLLPLGDPTSPRRYSPAIRAKMVDWSKTVRTKHLKPLHGGGLSALLLMGSWTEISGESTAGDSAYFDEFDRMPPNVDAAFRKSLSSSPFGFLNVFSTPTFPGFGVSKKYAQSDKKRWLYKCPSCNQWQTMSRENISQVKGLPSLIQRLEAHDSSASFECGTFVYICAKCRKPLDRWGAKSQWVAEAPGSDWSGYHMSQCDCVWISADDIMTDLRELGPGLGPFYNYDLGLPYLGDGGSVTKGLILTLVNPNIPPASGRAYFDTSVGRLTVGIGLDWGKRNWCVILAECSAWSKPAILACEVFTDDPRDSEATVRRALDLVSRWGGSGDFGVVADVGYGQDRNPKLYSALGNVFYACQYPPQTPGARKPLTAKPSFGVCPPPPDASSPIVCIDRTASLKALIQELRAGSYQVAALREEVLLELDRHCSNVVITTDVDPSKFDKRGIPVEVAVTLGDDHFLHALNYAKIALEHAKRHRVCVGDVDSIPYGCGVDEAPGISGVPTFEDVTSLYDLLIPDLDIY